MVPFRQWIVGPPTRSLVHSLISMNTRSNNGISETKFFPFPSRLYRNAEWLLPTLIDPGQLATYNNDPSNYKFREGILRNLKPCKYCFYTKKLIYIYVDHSKPHGLLHTQFVIRTIDISSINIPAMSRIEMCNLIIRYSHTEYHIE
jgi:hypothetical protein